MGVCIEPQDRVLGIGKPFEQYQNHSAGEGQRSGPEDTDLTVYSLRRWARLAADGNPTILLLGFTPPEMILRDTEAGQRLRDSMGMFWSKRAAKRFTGYMSSQIKQMRGLIGRKHSNRPELVEAHGYDTKFAYHALRLGMQGIEFMDTQNITLPMPERSRQYLLSVRRGEVSLNDVLALADCLNEKLESYQDRPDIPDGPCEDAISRWVTYEYVNHWGQRD